MKLFGFISVLVVPVVLALPAAYAARDPFFNGPSDADRTRWSAYQSAAKLGESIFDQSETEARCAQLKEAGFDERGLRRMLSHIDDRATGYVAVAEAAWTDIERLLYCKTLVPDYWRSFTESETLKFQFNLEGTSLTTQGAYLRAALMAADGVYFKIINAKENFRKKNLSVALSKWADLRRSVKLLASNVLGIYGEGENFADLSTGFPRVARHGKFKDEFWKVVLRLEMSYEELSLELGLKKTDESSLIPEYELKEINHLQSLLETDRTFLRGFHTACSLVLAVR